MPTRRTFELIIITVVLAQPAMSVIRLWLRKHVATTQPGLGSDIARAGIELL